MLICVNTKAYPCITPTRIESTGQSFNSQYTKNITHNQYMVKALAIYDIASSSG